MNRCLWISSKNYYYHYKEKKGVKVPDMPKNEIAQRAFPSSKNEFYNLITKTYTIQI